MQIITLVTDYEQMRATIFNLDDEFFSTVKYKKFLWDILLCSESDFIACEADYAKEGERLYIKKFDYEGNELSILKEIVPEKKIRIPFGNGAIFSVEIPYSSKAVLTNDNSRELIYHCISEKYVIEVFDRTGKLIRIISRPYKRIHVRQEEKDEFFDHFKTRSYFDEIKKLVEIPDLKPAIESMTVDVKGNLWVKTNEMKIIDNLECYAYDIFTVEGVYLTRTWLDITPEEFYGSYMYTRKKDEDTGLRTVCKYRLIWSN